MLARTCDIENWIFTRATAFARGPDDPEPAQPDDLAAPAVDPLDLLRQAVAQLQLRTPPIGMTPPPSTADPNVLINVPAHVWLTDTGPSSVGPARASASDAGLTVSIAARLTHLTLDPGDGTAPITCARAEVLAPPQDPFAEPACGHTWQHTSRNQTDGVYNVTLTSHWDLTWSGAGYSGAFTTTTDADLPVAVTDRPISLLAQP